MNNFITDFQIIGQIPEECEGNAEVEQRIVVSAEFLLISTEDAATTAFLSTVTLKRRVEKNASEIEALLAVYGISCDEPEEQAAPTPPPDEPTEGSDDSESTESATFGTTEEETESLQESQEGGSTTLDSDYDLLSDVLGSSFGSDEETAGGNEEVAVD